MYIFILRYTILRTTDGLFTLQPICGCSVKSSIQNTIFKGMSYLYDDVHDQRAQGSQYTVALGTCFHQSAIRLNYARSCNLTNLNMLITPAVINNRQYRTKHHSE